MMVRLISLTALIVATVLAEPVGADDGDAARAAFGEGVERFAEGDYEEAARAFARANELKPSWKLEFNIGQCHAALKEYGLAIEAFERYLSVGGDDVPASRRDDVLAELRRLREMVGVLMISGPDGIEVYVDDVFRGVTPIDAGVLVPAGVPHRVRAVDGGVERLDREATVRGGGEVTIEVSVDDEPPAEEQEGDGTPGKDGLRPIYFWIGVGATAVFGATTLGLELGLGGKIDELEDDPEDGDARSSAESMQRANYAFIGLTGAAAIASVVLAFFTDFGGPESPGDGAEVALRPFATDAGGGVAIGGGF
jgi:hypothetical protein